MILGIDTSLGTAVGLVDEDGLVRVDTVSANPLGHAEVIGTLLADAVTACASEPIRGVAAGMGPGPFTGLRVGIAAARTFAIARSVPVIPVPSHDAAALAHCLAAAVQGASEVAPFAVVTDARRREFAYTVYDGLDADGLPHRRCEPALAHRDAVDDVLAARGAARLDTTSVSAAMLAICAARAVAAGRVLAGDEPLYLRSPDVQAPTAAKRVGA